MKIKKSKRPTEKLSPDNPSLQALNHMAELLGPFDRESQIKILSYVCTHFGLYEEAERFLGELRIDK